MNSGETVDDPRLSKEFLQSALVTKIQFSYRGFLITNKNPLFAWEAMQHCLLHQQHFINAGIPEECPPKWVRDYFATCSENLLKVSHPKKDAPQLISRALSLSSDVGKSLFDEYKTTLRNLDIYDKFRRLTHRSPLEKLNEQEELIAGEEFQKFPYQLRQEMLKRIRPQFRSMKKAEAYDTLARESGLSSSQIRSIIYKIDKSLHALAEESEKSA